MPGTRRALVAKEVRGLLRERLVVMGLIVMPALIMAIMGSIQAAAVKKTVEEASTVQPAVVYYESPEDRPIAAALAAALNASLERGSREDAARAVAGGYRLALVVEAGAAENLTQGRPVGVVAYYSLPGPSPAGQGALSRVSSVVRGVVRAFIAERCRQAIPGVSAELLASPARVEGYLSVWGKTIPAERYGSYLLSMYTLPVVVLVLLTSAVQVGAISIGMEREAKTLEMLLASPVTPGDVVVSKMLGVLVVALAGLASFTAGFAFYYHAVTSTLRAAGAPGEAVQAALRLTPQTGAVTVAALALALYTAAVLGLILGLGAQDVRGAQLVANYFAFLLLIPYFAVFVGIIPLGARGLALLADPLYPPLTAVAAAEFGRPGLAAAALAAQAGHAALWTLAASRLLSPERLIVGLPLSRLLARGRGRRRRGSGGRV
ncbi:MAG: ABC transporter permease [Desulfurococcales archaeon]|nr:ABC transporter permease [Desulfurococcales archaeon]